VLLAALHLSSRTGFLGAVAVLFAVNVTMILPITPGDVGVFQAVAAAVLHAGWQVPFSTGVAFGVVLQAVELVTALLMGVPAVLLEGLSWRQVIERPSGVAPVRLRPPAGRRRDPEPDAHPNGERAGAGVWSTTTGHDPSAGPRAS
jgi:phosphatidyl-myo-inositol alpha-mannosyltransferase